VDPWSDFAKALGTVGPVGIAFLAAWYLWLKYGRAQVPIDNAREHHENIGRLDEVRDYVRDTHNLSARILDAQQRTAEMLQKVSESQTRTAEVLERISYRQERMR
jgi:hypothetical protein